MKFASNSQGFYCWRWFYAKTGCLNLHDRKHFGSHRNHINRHLTSYKQKTSGHCCIFGFSICVDSLSCNCNPPACILTAKADDLLIKHNPLGIIILNLEQLAYIQIRWLKYSNDGDMFGSLRYVRLCDNDDDDNNNDTTQNCIEWKVDLFIQPIVITKLLRNLSKIMSWFACSAWFNCFYFFEWFDRS